MDFISKIQLPNGNDYLLKTETISTVSGSIATFDTSLALPLVECKAEIVAQQAGTGTPSPSNPRAISGFSSVTAYQMDKNLLDVLTEPITLGNITLTQADNGIQISGSESSAKNTYLFNGHLPVGDYVVFDSVQGSNSTHQITINNAGTTLYVTTAPKTFSVSSYEDTVSIRLYIYSGNTDTLIKPQLEVGSTASNYERPKQNTFTIALGQTVYGGSVDCINGSGLNSGVKLTLDGNISASDLRITAQTGYTRVEWYPYRDIGKGNETFKCDKFEFNTETGLYRVSNYNSTATPRMFFGLPDTVTTREEAIAWFASNPTEIVYELATPIEITGLTPDNFTTLAGENNIFADCGDISVSYFNSGASDTKKLIETVSYTKNEVDDIVDNHHDSFSNLTDTTISSPTNGQIVKYNGTKWINADNLANGVSLDGSAMQINNTNIQTFLNVLFDALKDTTVNLTASGSIATFSTSLALPLVACKAQIVARQASGTPTPSSPLPISGYDEVVLTHTGKNLFNKATITQDVAFIWNTGVAISENGSYTSDYIPVKPNTYFRCNKAISQCLGYDAEKNYIKIYKAGSWQTPQSGNMIERPFTVDPDIAFIRFSRRVGDMEGATIADDSNALQLELGSTATDYEPFNAETKTIALGQTVYGGELDVIMGKLIVTSIGHIFDGSENFGTIDNNKYLYNFGQMVKSSNIYRSSTLCSHFNVGNYGGWVDVLPNEYIIAGTYYFGVNPDMTLSDFRVWLAEQANNGTPLIVTATLQTPVEITGLTPANFTTLAGEQNIFADSGDVEVSFKQGIQEYIDAKIAETQA